MTTRQTAFACAAMVILSLVPQIHLWYERGTQWQGAYAAIQGDEFLYSAYINALTDGRSRRNDPFAGRDSIPNAPLPESTFSIQFVPAYVIAWLSRISGISSATAFIVLIAVAGFAASLATNSLLASITGNSRLAAVATLFVLCFGALAGGHGLVGLLIGSDVMFLGLPFLRRYQPAVDFPLFFVFCMLSWRAFTHPNKPHARAYAAGAGLVLVTLIFSYLYLWTAAATWIVCFSACWIYLRRNQTRHALETVTIVGIFGALAFVPYAYLLSHRPKDLDEAQTLVFTHRPDLFRTPELIGLVVVVVLTLMSRRSRVVSNDPRVIACLSFALLPFVLFNQQVITGRSMQPYHFENLVSNYAVLVAVVLVFFLPRTIIKPRLLALIASLSLIWGLVEVSLPPLSHYRSNIIADEMVPVLRRLDELAKNDGTLITLREQGRTSSVVFSPEREVMALLPTWAPQATLLGMGGLDFGGLTYQQRKELFYVYLYYRDADGNLLRDLLSDTGKDVLMNHYARVAVFGHERVLPILSFEFKPITAQEIELEVKNYEAFSSSFSKETVQLNPLSYLVIRPEDEAHLTHLDRWYIRDAGEKHAGYSLYKLTIRN